MWHDFNDVPGSSFHTFNISLMKNEINSPASFKEIVINWDQLNLTQEDGRFPYAFTSNGNELEDGDITTACQDACPTQAITFGDLNDQDSNFY